MKIPFFPLFAVSGLVLLQPTAGQAQGTAFTYQGRLVDAGAPANGSYDLRFAVYDSSGGGNQQGPALTNSAVALSDGVFTVTLDFGLNVFTGSPRWLDIGVRTNGGSSFGTLSPRQALSPSPYAIFATSASSAASASTLSGPLPDSSLSGAYHSAVSLNNSGNTFTGKGAGLTSLNADNIATGTLADTRLSSNVALRNANQTFTGVNIFTAGMGLGTNTPQAQLHIAGGGGLGYPQLELTQTANDFSRLRFTNPSNIWDVATGTDGTLRFWNGSADNVIFANNGDVWLAGAGTLNFGTTTRQMLNLWGTGFGIGVQDWTAYFRSGYGFAWFQGGSHTNGQVNPGPGGSTMMTLDNYGLTVLGSLRLGVGGTGFYAVGTTNNQAFQLQANGQCALRLEPNTNGAPNFIAGSSANAQYGGVVGATIGGGGAVNYQGSAIPNTVSADFTTISGGGANTISFAATNATIGGGLANSIQVSNTYATIGGGWANSINGSPPNHSMCATIGGGSGNNIAYGYNATIAGGAANTVGISIPILSTFIVYGDYGTVGGGLNNTAQGDASTVPGGRYNHANGANSFAAGYSAHADGDGDFVWADSRWQTFSSSTTNEFSVRATGGARIVTAIDNGGNPTAGVTLGPGATAWAAISDRNAKKDFAPVDAQEILAKLAQVPVERWRYKWEAEQATPHIGPMAQDFKAAFYPGRDDKTISTLEFDGVALAAIQGLNQKLQDELARRDAENAELKRSVKELQELVGRILAHENP